MSDKSAFEEALAEIGRRIDAVLNSVREWRGRMHNRMATGGLFERFQRPASGGPSAKERLDERVASLREGFEGGSMSPKLVLGAFGAGAALVLVLGLFLVFGLGLFRGTGLTAADLENDAQLRAAAERARAEQQGTLNPAAMMQQQQQDRAIASEVREAGRGGGDSGKAGSQPGG